MTKKEVSVGIVGCGYWGPLLIRNFINLPNCNVAVCDANEARLKHVKGLYPSLQCGTDYNKFLGEFDLDAFFLPTPEKPHSPLEKAGLFAGKHTFIEKPMAASSA